MIIRAYEKIYYPSRLPLLEKELAARGALTLLGYYEEMEDVFYLFHGSYEIAAAYRLDLPLTLVNCDMEDVLHYSEIDFDSMLEDSKGGRVFNRRGRAAVMDIIEAIPGFSGDDYRSEQLSSLRMLSCRQYRQEKEKPANPPRA